MLGLFKIITEVFDSMLVAHHLVHLITDNVPENRIILQKVLKVSDSRGSWHSILVFDKGLLDTNFH